MLDLDVAEGGGNLATSLLVLNGERVKLDTELTELARRNGERVKLDTELTELARRNGERVKLDTELTELIRSKKNKDIVNVLRAQI